MTNAGLPVSDVIVIGSGPAGCAAAATCARNGLKVMIVTPETEQSEWTVSTPAPLESIHPGVSSLLLKIGAAGAEEAATLSTYAGIYTGHTYAPLGQDENGIWEGRHINREIFNWQLLHRIQKSGVSVLFNEKVEDFILEKEKVVGIKTGSQEWYAKYIIDASGNKAIAGKKLKWKRQFFSPPLVCWTGISKWVEPFPFDQNAAHFIPGQQGWTWLAPQPPDYCAWTRLSLKGERTFLPPEEIKDWVSVGKVEVANMRWRMYRPVCSEGIVLCGDAAGILDPAAGQGIFNALWSGIIAGNTIISCLQQPDLASFHLAYYDDWFVQQFEGKVRQLADYYREQGIKMA